MQCLRTSCVEELLLFSLRFQIRAVESPDLWRASGSELNTAIDFSLCAYHSTEMKDSVRDTMGSIIIAKRNYFGYL